MSGNKTFRVHGADVVTILFLLLALGVTHPSNAAENLDQLIADAKKEGELALVAGAETFGGRKGFAELEAAFNKKFGLKARINFTPVRRLTRWQRGPSPRARQVERRRIFILGLSLILACSIRKRVLKT